MDEREPFSFDDVVAVERAVARAWPALRVEAVAGWAVRLSGGGTRRTNSVLPIGYDNTPLDDAIVRVEALYRGQRTRSYFMVSPVATPLDLDAQLERRGYTYEEPCLLQAKRLVAGVMPRDVEVTDRPSDDWLSVCTELLDPIRRAAMPSVLAVVPASRAFLLLRRQGRPVATALAVVAPDGTTVVECVATHTSARRSGAAQTIMDALEAWAFDHGGKTSALQVVAHNTPAVQLYQRRGYREIGRYHYRWKDV
jgi:N-acetylglutamate synthase